MNANVLTVNWAPEAGKQFVITMNVVEKLSSEFLLNSLKEKPTISVDITKFTSKYRVVCYSILILLFYIPYLDCEHRLSFHKSVLHCQKSDRVDYLLE